MNEAAAQKRAGFLAGLIAYGIWGVLPIYIKALAGVHVIELIAHRVLWSLLLMALLLLMMRKQTELRTAFASPRMLGWLLLSSLLIGLNWSVYAVAILDNRVLDASLGYFINPLISVALGVLVLREQLRRWQWLAVLCAAAGVAVQAWLGGTLPWLALFLALSFALYALVRKQLLVDPVVGLMVETLLLAPFALGYLWLQDAPVWSHGAETNALLILSGVVTGVPFVCFAYAARRLPLSSLGLMQYIAPSIVFMLAVFAYGEPVNWGRMLAFVLIWVGLAIFVIDGLRLSRAERKG